MKPRDPRNCISYWFPKLEWVAGLNVPRTILIRAPGEIRNILDGFGDKLHRTLAAMIRAAGDGYVGWPLFLRTGQTAGKHAWPKTCYMPPGVDDATIMRHLYHLAEYSEMVDMIGLPFDVLACRQFLQLKHAFMAFDGMPVGREYRCFVGGGAVRCVHPYWPRESIRNASVDGWANILDSMYAGDPPADMLAQASRVAERFAGDGEWSVDVCETVDGAWYVTDMAVAAESFHWPGCKNEEMTP